MVQRFHAEFLSIYLFIIFIGGMTKHLCIVYNYIFKKRRFVKLSLQKLKPAIYKKGCFCLFVCLFVLYSVCIKLRTSGFHYESPSPIPRRE